MLIDRQLPEALDVAAVQPIPAPATRGKKKRPKRYFVTVGGVRYPLMQDPRSKTWRIRKRTKDVSVDIGLGVVGLQEAEAEARRRLGKSHATATRLRGGGATLREIVDAYRAMPKRCSEDTAEANIQRFTKIVKVAWGKGLDDGRADDLPSLWEDYSTKRQGGKLDLATRRHENRGINSAIRMGVSLFHRGLEERYQRADIALNFEAIRRVEWLPEIPSKLPKLKQENIDKMIKALTALKETDRPMWRAIMIARYSGLRSREVSGAHKTWLIQNTAGAWCFEVRDRPEEGWWHKTGEDYTAPILSPELVEDLLACPAEGPLVPVEGSRDHFFRKTCNRWLRQFIPRPNKGMHRLRALYAEGLKAATEKAVLAEQAGIEEARKALGHTTSRTTTDHYLPAT